MPRHEGHTRRPTRSARRRAAIKAREREAKAATALTRRTRRRADEQRARAGR